MSEIIQCSEIIKQFIENNFLFGDGSKITADTLLIEKGIIDSTGVIELVAFMEENFNIKIKDEEILQAHFSSLNAIASFLQFKINGNALN